MSYAWQEMTIAPSTTHHLVRGRPAYSARFEAVLKFHAPGLAPVRDATGAYHITPDGQAAYKPRFIQTFGFYEGRAAVQSDDGWFHIFPDGRPCYEQLYDWCGNFQDGRCTVRHSNHTYCHILLDGHAAYVERYRYAGDYRDGIAVVQHENGLHTHIDRTGQLLHGKWFLDLDVFHKGFARAHDLSGWHHIDSGGNPIYAQRFAHIEPFYNGQARVGGFDGSLLVINETGTVIVRLREALH
jgi:WG containing repeat